MCPGLQESIRAKVTPESHPARDRATLPGVNSHRGCHLTGLARHEHPLTRAVATFGRWRRVPVTPRMHHPGTVNAIIIETVVRSDGKRYPVGGVLPDQERNRARWLAHRLVCRDRHSIRQAQKIMLAEHGCRRSLGIICRDLQRFECPECR